MNHNIIVHYNPEKGYLAARKEIEKTLTDLGDKKPSIEKTPDGSVIGITTKLNAKELIKDLKEKTYENPAEFTATKKWIPIEEWSDANINAMQKQIKEMLPQISAGERWTAQIETWNKQPAEPILQMLKETIQQNYVEEGGTKIAFIEIQGDKTAISILKPDDIFEVIDMSTTTY